MPGPRLVDASHVAGPGRPHIKHGDVCSPSDSPLPKGSPGRQGSKARQAKCAYVCVRRGLVMYKRPWSAEPRQVGSPVRMQHCSNNAWWAHPACSLLSTNPQESRGGFPGQGRFPPAPPAPTPAPGTPGTWSRSNHPRHAGLMEQQATDVQTIKRGTSYIQPPHPANIPLGYRWSQNKGARNLTPAKTTALCERGVEALLIILVAPSLFSLPVCRPVAPSRALKHAPSNAPMLPAHIRG